MSETQKKLKTVKNKSELLTPCFETEITLEGVNSLRIESVFTGNIWAFKNTIEEMRALRELVRRKVDPIYFITYNY